MFLKVTRLKEGLGEAGKKVIVNCNFIHSITTNNKNQSVLSFTDPEYLVVMETMEELEHQLGMMMRQ